MASCIEDLYSATELAFEAAEELHGLTNGQHELLRPWLAKHEYAVWKNEFEGRFGAKPGEWSNPDCAAAVYWANLWRAITAEVTRIRSEHVV